MGKGQKWIVPRIVEANDERQMVVVFTSFETKKLLLEAIDKGTVDPVSDDIYHGTLKKTVFTRDIKVVG